MAREEPLPFPDEAFCKRWHSRVIEVIDTYQPDLIYFDNKLDLIDEEYRLDFLSYYYNQAKSWDRDVMVTYKFKDLEPWAGVLDLERARMSELKKFPWLTDDSVDWGSWCNVQEPDYKSTNRLIDFLVDVVSKNGCVLLNVTPTAAGEIPEAVQERLLEMGDWLKINGEAIYDTRPWILFGEGPTEVVEGHMTERQNADNTVEDIRFTQHDNILYAICLDVPGSTDISIKSLNPENGIRNDVVKSVQLLGSEQEITWEISEDQMTIQLQEIPDLKHAICFRIETN
jgi:alpha-L-fucosidase